MTFVRCIIIKDTFHSAGKLISVATPLNIPIITKGINKAGIIVINGCGNKKTVL